MPQILIIAQGEGIAKYARELKQQIDNPDDVEIIIAHMEDAERIVKRYIGEIEVVVARGTTADILRSADLPVSVVEIPVSNAEIIDSIKKAKELAGDQAVIAFFGLHNVINSIRSFLDFIDIQVKVYEIHSTEDTHAKIEQMKRDHIDVAIGGKRSCEWIVEAGMKAVLLESSLLSIRAAYEQAQGILRAMSIEKQRSQETQTIFNSVSEAIISVDADMKIVMSNYHADMIFALYGKKLSGMPVSRVFSSRDTETIREVLKTGEELIGDILERQDHKYAVKMVPIIVDGAPSGVVVTLQEIQALQRIEATVRKGLAEKGNEARYTFSDIKGGSAALNDVVENARSFARLESNVLIIGETGTGKELFAQSIHNASSRRNYPFVAVNCGSIPANLMESELFGYESGAFTGAKKGGKAGFFELAHGGTIFLDEIVEMDQAGQVNLLRALQERQIRRVGGDSVIPVDVRVIAACNVNLFEMVQHNKFRKDLYYRLSVLVMKVPPLRERRGDISRLAAYFVAQYNRQFGKDIVLSEAALRTLESFEWDGNIRQLKNFCERLTAIAEDQVLSSAYVNTQYNNSYWFEESASAPTHQLPPAPASDPVKPDQESNQIKPEDAVIMCGQIYSRSQLIGLLEQYKWRREDLAKALGVSRTTLWKNMKRLGISDHQSC